MVVCALRTTNQRIIHFRCISFMFGRWCVCCAVTHNNFQSRHISKERPQPQPNIRTVSSSNEFAFCDFFRPFTRLTSSCAFPLTYYSYINTSCAIAASHRHMSTLWVYGSPGATQPTSTIRILEECGSSSSSSTQHQSLIFATAAPIWVSVFS